MDGGDGDLRVAVRHLDGKGGGGRKVLRVRLGRRSGKPDRTEEVTENVLDKKKWSVVSSYWMGTN